MATKPTKVTDWATDGVNALTAATDTTKHDLGWQTTPDNLPGQVGERPNLEMQNYWQLAVHEWVEYFQVADDELQDNIDTVQDNLDDLFKADLWLRVIEGYAFSFDPSDVDIGADTITEVSGPVSSGDVVQFTTTGTLPLGLSLATDYHIIALTADTFQVATTDTLAKAGTAVVISDIGSGVHTTTFQDETYLRPSETYTTYSVLQTFGSSLGTTVNLPPLSETLNGRKFKIIKGDHWGYGGVKIAADTTANDFMELIETNKDKSSQTNVLLGYSDSLTVFADIVVRGPALNRQWSLSERSLRNREVARVIENYSEDYATTDVSIAGDMIVFNPSATATIEHGDVVQFTTTGTLPAGLSLATDYYILPRDAFNYSLTTSLANLRSGTIVDITDVGSGTHTITSQSEWNIFQGDGFNDYLFLTDGVSHSVTLPYLQSFSKRKEMRIRKNRDIGTLSIIPQTFPVAQTINEQTAGIQIFTGRASTKISNDDADDTGWAGDFEQVEINLNNSGDFDALDQPVVFSRRENVVTFTTIKGMRYPSNVQGATADGIVPVRFRPNAISPFYTACATFALSGAAYGCRIHNSGKITSLCTVAADLTNPAGSTYQILDEQ